MWFPCNCTAVAEQRRRTRNQHAVAVVGGGSRLGVSMVEEPGGGGPGDGCCCCCRCPGAAVLSAAATSSARGDHCTLAASPPPPHTAYQRFLHRFSGRRRDSDYCEGHEEEEKEDRGLGVEEDDDEVVDSYDNEEERCCSWCCECDARISTDECDRMRCSGTSNEDDTVTRRTRRMKRRSRRTPSLTWSSSLSSPVALLSLLLLYAVACTDACSSRTTPKPRPPVAPSGGGGGSGSGGGPAASSGGGGGGTAGGGGGGAAPTPARPNITFHTYVCPPDYAIWYCLNGATCFTVKIGESLLYNCECADGFMGPRCEYKDLDGSYLPSQRRFMLETASIAGGATVAALLVVALCAAAYVHVRRRAKQADIDTASMGRDCVDGCLAARSPPPHVRRPTFGRRHLPAGDAPASHKLQHVTTLLPTTHQQLQLQQKHGDTP